MVIKNNWNSAVDLTFRDHNNYYTKKNDRIKINITAKECVI